MSNYQVQKVINSKDADDIIHMVIGHAQIKGCWDIKFDLDELNFPVDWLCMPSGLPDDFLKVIKNEMRMAVKPLKISAIIWQNSLHNITLESVKRILSEADRLYLVYPQHSIAFPEIMFLPKLKDFSAKTAKINSILAEYNSKRDYDKYSLFKAGTAKNNWEEGLYLKNKRKFTSFIRKFHLHNFFGSKKENFEITFENTPQDNVETASIPPDNNDNHVQSAKQKWLEEGLRHGWIKEIEDKAKADLYRKLILKSKSRIAQATKTANKICRKGKILSSSESSSNESTTSSSGSSDESSDEDTGIKKASQSVGSKNKRKRVV